ncbi:MAG TPA: cupredoxin domain-containing protein [Acidimicrobiales bacterium]
MRRSLIGAFVLVSVGLFGCGSTDDGGDGGGGLAAAEESGGGAAVEVVAEDIKFAESGLEAAAGEVEFTYTNDGVIGHTLLIDGVDDFKLEVEANGDVDEGTVTLDAGSYTVYCDIAGHREAGMETTLEVS